jgi:hypothetical protein
MKQSSSMQQAAYENDGAVSLDLWCAPGLGLGAWPASPNIHEPCPCSYILHAASCMQTTHLRPCTAPPPHTAASYWLQKE